MTLRTDLRVELDGLFRTGRLGEVLGFRLVEWRRAVVELRPSAAVANIAGSVHGGVLYALGDSAFEVACNSYGRVCVALDVSATTRRPRRSASRSSRGRWRCRGPRGSRRTGSRRWARGEVRAWYQATAYRTFRWHLGADRWPEAWRAVY